MALALFLSPSTFVLIAGWCLVAPLLALHSSRRELAPLYASLSLHVLSPIVSPSLSSPLHSAVITLTVFALALAWIVSVLFPWPDLSQLHGPYRTIGCRAVRLGGIECRVFYPSTALDESASPIHPDGVATKRFVPYLHHGHHIMKGLSSSQNLPAWLFHNMSNAHLGALQDAPIASRTLSSAGWPVVIFSHGLAGSLELYSCVNQELASHGYVVVVPNHCDGSACVCSPETGRFEYYQQITAEVRDDIDQAGFRFRNGQLQQRVREVRSVLDAIVSQSTAPTSVFNQCNLDEVSVAGHSFGAATALSVAHQDKRFKKMVLLDAWMEPLDDAVRDGLGARVPALHLMSEHFLHWRPNAKSTERHARGCTHTLSRLTWLRDTRHNNFSDISVFSPILNRLLKSIGKIDHFRALQAIGELSAAFLDGDFDARACEFPELAVVTTVE
uniref:1-alkyl-2-acetylglycerophosphocholine esterase n=1 Tax=Peronospora matthiolae TaxID=2874970 RepID=A0AAV1V6Y2_9STRA